MPPKEIPDFLMIGLDKPMGYLWWAGIRACGHDPEAYARDLANRGLTTFTVTKLPIIATDTPKIIDHKTVLCTFDPKALGVFLSFPERQAILEAANWPTEPEAFARKVMAQDPSVPSPTPFFDLVADAFADKTNPGRLKTERPQKPPHPIPPRGR